MTPQRVYRGLLWLYPSAFRREYGDDMVEAFGEALRDDRRGALRFWMAALVDLVRSASREHWRTGGEVWMVVFKAATDRHVFRAVGGPFALGLMLITSGLTAGAFGRLGVDTGMAFPLVVAVVPQALAVAIPSALLIALLVGLRRQTNRSSSGHQSDSPTLSKSLPPVTVLALVAVAATSFTTLVMMPDANQAFREMIAARQGIEAVPSRGLYELGIRGLLAHADELRASGLPAEAPIMAAHQRIAIPVACLVFAGFGLGIRAHRTKRAIYSVLAGLAVILLYYALMTSGMMLARGAWVSPHLAAWIPNLVLGTLASMLLLQRARPLVIN